jgi:A/G-specific adenine glycosylase
MTSDEIEMRQARPAAEETADIRVKLISWFEQNGRDLPWRRTRDPYRILVAEVMLQQTQVDRVIPYYHQFLERFPTVHALAHAPVSEAIHAWTGLGYNRRAVNLKRTAKVIVEVHQGVFPRETRELVKLPGIGSYTAGAIACFAYEEDVAFLDTNMKRVVHRLFVGPDMPRPGASDRELQAQADNVLPVGDAWRWNQGLMEFGALHCTARKPACVVCPLQARCRAFPAIQTVLAMLPPGTRRKKEEAFADSNRYYRGRIVRALREEDGKPLTLTDLGQRVRPGFSESDSPWLARLVLDLQRDGLARVAEEFATYDAGTFRDVKVSLP